MAVAIKPAFAGDDFWVTANELNRRTCPSEECGIVGKLLFREKVQVHEEKDGWVRISKFYDGACNNGRSSFVEEGNDTCSPDNGITEGKLAEWVAKDHLSSTRPSDPGLGASGAEKLVAKSDDFQAHRKIFAGAALKLISAGTCTEKDFLDMGGWVKSTKKTSPPTYFTYCRDGRDRIYLNAETGRTYK